MGIRFFCPNGHKLNVKSFLAGQMGICPYCGIKVEIPLQSTRAPSHKEEAAKDLLTTTAAGTVAAPAKKGLAVEPTPRPSIPAPSAGSPGMGPSGAPLSGEPVPASPIPMPPSITEAMKQPTPFASAPAPVVAAPTPAFSSMTTPAGQPPAPPLPPASFGPSDPLAEAPDAVWYVRPGSGGQFGPAAPSVMRAWIHEGRVAADSLVWREGWRDWQEAGKTFPQLLGDALPAFPATHAPRPVEQLSPVAAVQDQRAKARQKSKKSQMLLIIGLVVAVVALVVVLAIVSWPSSDSGKTDGTEKIEKGPPKATSRLTSPVESVVGTPMLPPSHLSLIPNRS